MERRGSCARVGVIGCGALLALAGFGGMVGGRAAVEFKAADDPGGGSILLIPFMWALGFMGGFVGCFVLTIGLMFVAVGFLRMGDD